MIRASAPTALVPKGEGLVRWFYKFPSYAEMAKERDKKAEEGTMLHEMVTKIALGQRPRYTQTIPEIVWEKAECFERWQKDYDARILAVEQMVFSDQHEIAGHPDLQIQIGRDEGIVDVKSGGGPYLGQEMQVEAYSRIVETEYGQKDQLRSILLLDPDKHKDGYEFVSREGDDEMWKAYLGLLACLRYEMREKLARLNGSLPLHEALTQSIRQNGKKATRVNS